MERTKELGIFYSKIKLQYIWNVPEAEFPKGRIFAIDSQDQFKFARPLLQEKHEQIGKSYSVLLLSLPFVINPQRAPQRQHCEPHGLDEHRDPELNHYTCSEIDSQISTLTNDTNVSMVD